MREIQLNIDGREVKAEEGMTIFEAARKAGIKIPHLCYREDLTPTTACRLCVVEVEGARTLVASCAYPWPTRWSFVPIRSGCWMPGNWSSSFCSPIIPMTA